MNEKPTYRFEIKSKRTGKMIKHYINKPDYGYYVPACSEHDKQMINVALGIVMGLMNDYKVYVEVYRLNDSGGYDLIRTQH